MALDDRGGIAGDWDGLDHVGIKRALGEKRGGPANVFFRV